jgi:hypothetical protein
MADIQSPKLLYFMLLLLNAFDRWLGQRSLVLFDLNEAVVNLFLEERSATGRLGHGDPQTVRCFLDHLRVNRVVRFPEPVTDESPLASLGRQDESYLKKERGLSPVKPRLWIRGCAPLEHFPDASGGI